MQCICKVLSAYLLKWLILFHMVLVRECNGSIFKESSMLLKLFVCWEKEAVCVCVCPIWVPRL